MTLVEIDSSLSEEISASKYLSFFVKIIISLLHLKYCCCFTRKFRWNEAEPPADLKAAFNALADGKAQIGPEQLRRFVTETQGDDDAEQVIEKILQQPHRRQIGKASREIFVLQDLYQYLFSEELNLPLKSE